MRKILYFAGICLALCGCNREKDTAAGEHEPRLAQQTAPNPLPETPGVYCHAKDQFDAIAPGAANWLQTTNAERGFGFRRPVGASLEYCQDIAVQTSQLHEHFLQLTAYEGVAVQTPYPFDPVTDANTAFIAKRIVPFAQTSNGQNVDLHFSQPLEPGFYVLHDERFLRAKNRRDAGVYYPFIITAKGNTPWQAAADGCFKDLEGKEGHVPAEKLKECVAAQRIAWKIAGDGNARSALFEQRTVFLAHKLQPQDSAVHKKVVSLMDDDNTDISENFYRMAQDDVFSALLTLKTDYQNGAQGDADAQQAVVRFFMPEQLQRDIRMAAWIPFSRLAADDPGLEALFENIAAKEDWRPLLVDLIAAIQWKQVCNHTQNGKTAVTWRKTLAGRLPEDIKERAAALHFSMQKSSVRLGPMRFEHIPEETRGLWYDKAKDFLTPIENCLASAGTPENATFVLEIEADRLAPDHTVKAILRDPIDSLRPKPAIRPETVQCIVRTFRNTTMEAPLDKTAKIQIAITFLHHDTP